MLKKSVTVWEVRSDGDLPGLLHRLRFRVRRETDRTSSNSLQSLRNSKSERKSSLRPRNRGKYYRLFWRLLWGEIWTVTLRKDCIKFETNVFDIESEGIILKLNFFLSGGLSFAKARHDCNPRLCFRCNGTLGTHHVRFCLV